MPEWVVLLLRWGGEDWDRWAGVWWKKEGKWKQKGRQLCGNRGCAFLLLQRRSLPRMSLGCLFAHDAIASGQSSGLSQFQPQMSFPGSWVWRRVDMRSMAGSIWTSWALAVCLEGSTLCSSSVLDQLAIYHRFSSCLQAATGGLC